MKCVNVATGGPCGRSLFFPKGVTSKITPAGFACWKHRCYENCLRIMKPNNFTGSEKMDLNKRIVKFYVKFCGWKIGILERCLRNILLSIIAILGNTLILVAMRRESLERPSKLLCDERFSANWTFAGNATITGKIVR